MCYSMCNATFEFYQRYCFVSEKKKIRAKLILYRGNFPAKYFLE